MKALTIRGHGELSVLALAEVPTPALAQPTDVRIALRTAALNHLDLWTLQGLPGLTLPFPHILGGDGAGIVDAVGDGVTAFVPGDRVLINPGISCYQCEFCRRGEHSLCLTYRLLGEHLPGTLAEYVVVPETNVAVIPTPPPPEPEITWPEAAAFGLATLTAWRMIVTRARLEPGETVLIWGIGGGVASAALGIVKTLGGRVIATSSSDAKLEVAGQRGADVTLNHGEVDVPREVRRLTGKRGADVVIDNVGEATWERSLRSLAKQGRLVTCGGTTGAKVVTDVRRLFWNHYTIMGSTMGNESEFREIVRRLGRGELRPQVDSVSPLSRGREALARLAAGRQLGKIVVEM